MAGASAKLVVPALFVVGGREAAALAWSRPNSRSHLAMKNRKDMLGTSGL